MVMVWISSSPGSVVVSSVEVSGSVVSSPGAEVSSPGSVVTSSDVGASVVGSSVESVVFSMGAKKGMYLRKKTHDIHLMQTSFLTLG